MVIDDGSREDLVSALGTRWRAVDDRVMGGVSEARLRREMVDGRRCLHLSSEVRLDNSGGFVQMALDLSANGRTIDASGFASVRLVVRGNRERYAVHLRTADVTRPWQSYRAHFDAGLQWREVRLPFADFAAHRVGAPLDLTRLRRLGIVAIGRAFHADVAVAEIGRVDLVIHCAGTLHDDGAGIAPERRLADVDPVKIARSFAINATGPLLVAKHVAPLLPRHGRAVFASLSARVGSIGDNRLGGWYGYRASKAAQNMFTRTLSIELKRRIRGIVCVALHPGTVDTDLSRPFQGAVPQGTLFPVDRAARQLLEVIDGLGPADNGGFFAYDGQPIPW